MAKLSSADLIRKELKKYSWKTLREFSSLFPCPNEKGLVEVYTKEHSEDPDSDNYLGLEYVEIESVEDFWKRWNRFKKIKAFL